MLKDDDPGGGEFALFLRPHPGAFRQLMYPHPKEFAHFFKKMLMPGGGMGIAGIDWCIRVARGVAEGNSSFLSALQTSQVLHNSIVHS